MEISNIKIEPLTNLNINLVEGFSCGEIFFDEYLIEDSLYEIPKTYLIICDNNLLGYFSITATGLLHSEYENGELKQIYNKPAIEINYFAIDVNYQHKIISTENKLYYSNLIFYNILYFINNIDILGFEFIVLYSVPSAINFYKKHGFKEFESYMSANDKQYLQGCTPLFIKIK